MGKSKCKIAIGSDHAGLTLKRVLLDTVLQNKEVRDFGAFEARPVDYPDIAFKVVNKVVHGEFDKGILICGTGIGMAIAANKVSGIRAATCHNCFTAKMSIRHNDANVLCLGARTIGEGTAREIVDIWLKERFEGGRHQKRLQKIEARQNENS